LLQDFRKFNYNGGMKKLLTILFLPLYLSAFSLSLNSGANANKPYSVLQLSDEKEFECVEQILAYTDFCDENGDEDGEEYRKVEKRLAQISGKDMSKFSLHEWWEAEGAENLAFDIALPEPKLVPDITKDELSVIVERMLAPVPEFDDDFLEAFYIRVKFACKGAYFAEFLKLNCADTFSFELFERQKIDGVMRELSANEIVEILWGKRG